MRTIGSTITTIIQACRAFRASFRTSSRQVGKRCRLRCLGTHCSLLVLAVAMPGKGGKYQQNNDSFHQLMTEVAGTGKDHGQTMLVGGGDDFLVAH